MGSSVERWFSCLPVILTSTGLIVCLAFAFAPAPSTGSAAIPLGPMDETLRTPPFKAAYENLYTVDLEVDRTLPMHETFCLLGLPDFRLPTATRQNCGAARPTFMVNWALRENGHVVAEGGSEEGQYSGSASAFAQDMGHLKLYRGHTYVLEAVVDGDLGRLRQANPRLKVKVHPQAFTGGIVGRAGWLLAALVFAILLAGLLIEIGLRRWTTRRRAVHVRPGA